MGRRSKKDLEFESNEKSVLLAKAWRTFCDAMQEFFDGVDEIRVELSFESSFTETKHHSFSSDDVIFPREVVISPLNRVCFKVPCGIVDKTFNYIETDSINVYFNREAQPLNQVIDTIFSKCMSDVDGISNVADLETLLSRERDLPEVLNNVEDFLRVKSLHVKRADLYGKLPYYGLF